MIKKSGTQEQKYLTTTLTIKTSKYPQHLKYWLLVLCSNYFGFFNKLRKLQNVSL